MAGAGAATAAATVRLRLCRARDISTWHAAAIAVSSNTTLAANNQPSYWRFAGREGTNGAVHAAAGPELARAVRALPSWVGERKASPRASAVGERERLATRCAVGGAVSTPACGALACKHVIHAVCPDGLYGERSTEHLLRATYRAVLSEAAALGCESVVLPAIGCGVQGWRPAVAARCE
jgi:O-acetyl-ADP-ribose deacetylase (regulator of RNase III)